jgi:hypothetical protein
MPGSQNALLESRSPSPPSPLTDLASPTIEAAPPPSIEAQSQLCECNTRWQHDFFSCTYYISLSPQLNLPLRLRLGLPCWVMDSMDITLNTPLPQFSSTLPPSKNRRLITFQVPSTPPPASQTSVPHSQKAAPHGHLGTTSGPGT